MQFKRPPEADLRLVDIFNTMLTTEKMPEAVCEFERWLNCLGQALNLESSGTRGTAAHVVQLKRGSTAWGPRMARRPPDTHLQVDVHQEALANALWVAATSKGRVTRPIGWDNPTGIGFLSILGDFIVNTDCSHLLYYQEKVTFQADFDVNSVVETMTTDESDVFFLHAGFVNMLMYKPRDPATTAPNALLATFNNYLSKEADEEDGNRYVYDAADFPVMNGLAAVVLSRRLVCDFLRYVFFPETSWFGPTYLKLAEESGNNEVTDLQGFAADDRMLARFLKLRHSQKQEYWVSAAKPLTLEKSISDPRYVVVTSTAWVRYANGASTSHVAFIDM